ncbi:MAG: putative manganese-dependent inorganic diphosphatase [Hespellia sp.]|nr:putative manganese-dependent inorganic diphosphatase [Hespellia sp.]
MTNIDDKKEVYVIGHKNPDTDSICSAIAYAVLKTRTTGVQHTAKRAGPINEETHYVLEHFQVKAPDYLSDLRLQVRDVDLRHIDGFKSNVSIRTAWEQMKANNINTLPVTRDGKLEGLITVGDIARSYMNVYDSAILSAARTQYRNIATTIDGTILTGNEHSYLMDGKVSIAASGPEAMAELIEENDLVILGNRMEAQKVAIDLNVSCMVICNVKEVDDEIIRQAEEKQIVVIMTPHDTFTAARLINQSIPIKHFMTRDGLFSFGMNDYIDDVKEVMAKKKFRDFPIIDDENNMLGFISRRRLLYAKKKQVILVDHNEKNQAVDGIEEAEVLEIIDHHRLSSIETMGPVFFRNQPVGCTATIVYQMYQEAGIVPDATVAALLCSAILSDTLMFRSPTCTPLDEKIARELAAIADIDVEKLAKEMFNAGSNLKGKTPEEIIFLDFKQFSVNEVDLGIGQVNSMDEDELKAIKEKILPHMEVVMEKHNLNMIFFMLTNIIKESTELICCGTGAKEEILMAYDMPLNTKDVYLQGVVSRKKQLVPMVVAAIQQ